ncbi:MULTISPECIES: NUDIX domain-containing protein [unclassified Bradyrhizobium]|uniref:NUDIX domain-containing protein n=1 Tax=unclassified Bradyrhizobium TaxID=2631580 RepID=UPI0024792792|nr:MULTISPECIES: NUDIX domain-containing protein [unclassified Bradyrhizobium]WGS23884.1 NUDIX domain-containing protein [Bradyrhizobium sp. ISRA463]WGS31198.1 NUDIX domain-containing protein [Bradyrhizobium sp. ISRA464]
MVQRPKTESEPFPGSWALPGGFVDIAGDRDLEACAVRKLKDKTGVVSPYLEQLGSWGSATRDPRGWSATHAYFALLPEQAAGRVLAATRSGSRSMAKRSSRGLPSTMPRFCRPRSSVCAARSNTPRCRPI